MKKLESSGGPTSWQWGRSRGRHRHLVRRQRNLRRRHLTIGATTRLPSDRGGSRKERPSELLEEKRTHLLVFLYSIRCPFYFAETGESSSMTPFFVADLCGMRPRVCFFEDWPRVCCTPAHRTDETKAWHKPFFNYLWHVSNLQFSGRAKRSKKVVDDGNLTYFIIIILYYIIITSWVPVRCNGPNKLYSTFNDQSIYNLRYMQNLLSTQTNLLLRLDNFDIQWGFFNPLKKWKKNCFYNYK
jgi:hypothetical protein